jgi:hypothetical protein
LALQLGATWLLRIVNFFVGIDIGPIGNIAISLLVFGGMVAGLWRLVRRRARRCLFLLLTALNFTIYAVMLPATGHGGRYQAVIMVFSFPLLGLGALEIVDWATARLNLGVRASGLGHAATATAVALLGLSSLVTWSLITDAGMSISTPAKWGWENGSRRI